MVRKEGLAAPLGVRSGTRNLEIVDGAVIPESADAAEVTVRNLNKRGAMPEPLTLEVRGLVDGKMIRHRVIPADEIMQAFAYHHLVPARYWYLGTLPPPGNPAEPKKRVPIAAPKPATP